MINFGVQPKWGYLLVSVCPIVAYLQRHRFVRNRNDANLLWCYVVQLFKCHPLSHIYPQTIEKAKRMAKCWAVMLLCCHALQIQFEQQFLFCPPKQKSQTHVPQGCGIFISEFEKLIRLIIFHWNILAFCSFDIVSLKIMKTVFLNSIFNKANQEEIFKFLKFCYSLIWMGYTFLPCSFLMTQSVQEVVILTQIQNILSKSYNTNLSLQLVH